MMKSSTTLNDNGNEIVVDERNNPRWENIWKDGLKPGESFDKFTSSPLLLDLIQKDCIQKGRALVPGCGRGYDVIALASDERYVIGLDLSRVAIASAREYYESVPQDIRPSKNNLNYVSGNFFELPTTETEKFNFIYDYTFLCALDPSLRNEWAQKMSDLVYRGGELLTLIYPICPKEGGPPFEVSLDIVKNLLEPVGFQQIVLEMVPDEKCHFGRVGTTGIGRWRKL